MSTSVSTVPFEQVFSDVWGHAPVSVGKHAYYVSFIDEGKLPRYTFLKSAMNFIKSFLIFSNLLSENLIEK
jgi:hypothetical protein